MPATADVVTGTGGDDVLVGLAGEASQVSGGDGADRIFGDPSAASAAMLPSGYLETSELVSLGLSGADSNGDSLDASFSPDATLVVFSSASDNLVAGFSAPKPGGTYYRQIYMRDLLTDTTTAVSVGSGGAAGSGDSGNPVFSPDGTRIAFVSSATNLPGGDTSGLAQVYVKDLATGALTLVSRSSGNGAAGNGAAAFSRLSFAPDGQRIAYASSATNLVTGTMAGNVSRIYVSHLGTGDTVMVSRSVTTTQLPNKSSIQPVFAPDGTRIAFRSEADTLVQVIVAGQIQQVDFNGTADIYMATLGGPQGMTLQAVQAVSTLADGSLLAADQPGQPVLTGDVGAPVFSPDGSRIAFAATAPGLVAGDGNGKSDIIVKDLGPPTADGVGLTGALALVSVAADGTASNGDSVYPVFRADGRALFFVTNGTALYPLLANGTLMQLVMKDLVDGSVTLVSRATCDGQGGGQPGCVSGSASDGVSFPAEASSDGRRVVFSSTAKNLVLAGPSNNARNIYVATFAEAPVAGTADILAGGAGSDRLFGGAGNDRLLAGPGTDESIGGSGVDRLVLDGPPHRYALSDLGRGRWIVADLMLQAAAPAGQLVNGAEFLREVELLEIAGVDYPLAGGLPANQTPQAGQMLLVLQPGIAPAPVAIASDPDGDALTYTVVKAPAAGTVTIDAQAGTFLYAPTDGKTLKDGFEIRATDPYDAGASRIVDVVLSQTINGDGGPNILTGGPGPDIITGGGGNDRLDGGGGADQLAGGSGDDTYVVDNAGDLVVELASQGNDTVLASIDYTLPAHVENGVITGSSGRSLTGNSLDNRLTGGPGADKIAAGAGNDTVDGGAGADSLDGGAGLDLVSYAASTTGVTVSLTTGAGSGGHAAGDKITGFEFLTGSPKNDRLTGSTLANRLTGGGGADILTGGKGADLFIYEAPADSAKATPDQITDLVVAERDVIDLSAIDASSRTAGNQAFVFIGSKAFSGKAGQLRFAKGRVEADINGDRKADFVIKVKVTGKLSVRQFRL